MDFGFTAEQERFRDQVRRELRGPAVQAALADVPAGDIGGPELQRLYRVLGERGLLAPHWPAEYGGQGATFTEGVIVTEELARAQIPETLHISTIQIVGQFLLMAGTPEQQKRYLPGMASGEDQVSVLYTEPGAGSDLGSLATVAEPDGDGYRITGTKIFSLKTQIATYGLCAARTAGGATKYQGISLFMVDMTAPGIRVTPIPSSFDEPFYRVELDGAPVHRDAVLGVEGDGWALLSKGLAVERTGLDYYLKAERWFNASLACLAGQPPRPPAARGSLLEQVGRHAASLHASHLLAWEVLTGLGAGHVDEIASAVAKYHASELAGTIARWGGTVPDATSRTAASSASSASAASAASAAALLDEGYLEAPGLTLSAGASEMMLQLIAAAIDTSGQESS
jgi:alkylation response protein AidB-like acyl-CoA dehydrogenase